MFDHEKVYDSLKKIGYEPLMINYKTNLIGVNLLNGGQAEVLGIYDKNTDSLKPMPQKNRSDLEKILLSVGINHKKITHKKEKTNLS